MPTCNSARCSTINAVHHWPNELHLWLSWWPSLGRQISPEDLTDPAASNSCRIVWTILPRFYMAWKCQIIRIFVKLFPLARNAKGHLSQTDGVCLFVPGKFCDRAKKYFFFQLWSPNYFFERESPNNFLTWNPEHNNQHTDWNIVEANFQKPSQIFSISSSSKWCGWLVV